MSKRAELRRQQKAAAHRVTYSYNAAQEEEMKQQLYQAAMDRARRDLAEDIQQDAILYSFGVALDVLHKHYGFGSKRLYDFAMHMCDFWTNDKRTVIEVQDDLYRMTGVKFKKED